MAHLFNGTIEIPIDKQSNCYFIDRDGETFKYILSYLRCGEIHPDILDNPGKLHMIKHEANYFHLDELVTKLENLVYETIQLDTSNISVEPRKLLTDKCPFDVLSAHCNFLCLYQAAWHIFDDWFVRQC